MLKRNPLKRSESASDDSDDPIDLLDDRIALEGPLVEIRQHMTDTLDKEAKFLTGLTCFFGVVLIVLLIYTIATGS